MYTTSQTYKTRLHNGALQHIRGVFTDASGTSYSITGDDIIGTPRYDKQCVDDTETFDLGRMYVGTMELRLNTLQAERDFAGGEMSLDFGVSLDDTDEPEIEWIPLGVWDISAERESEHVVVIRGTDHLARLKTATGRSEIGLISMASAMSIVTELTGVEFAQTAAQIAAMINAMSGGERVRIYGVEFAQTCWDEVRMIAQIVGGFAYADRFGRIAFKRFSREPDLTITANERFNARVGELPCKLGGVGYTDKYGHTYAVKLSGGIQRITPYFTENRYIWDTGIDYQEYYDTWLAPIAEYYASVTWYAGTIGYYGDPAIDLGDMITIAGGIKGEGSANLLVCAESWQFRAEQTLISAGVPESAATSSSSGGGAVSSTTQILATKNINTVLLSTSPGSLYAAEKTVANGAFSCKSETAAFMSIGIVFSGNEDSECGVNVYFDGVLQQFSPRQQVNADEHQTAFFTLPLIASGGTHTVTAKAFGDADAVDITAYVWGQEITAESPQMTGANDYTYTVSEGITTVTGYIGSSDYPEIPQKLGSAATTIIADTAFTTSTIRAVYIPEGVEKIQ